MPLLLAILAATICFDAMPGVNWPIWTTLASVFLYRSALGTHAAAARASRVPLVLAVVLSLGAAVTADNGEQALICVSVVVLLAVAMRVAAGADVSRVGSGFIAASPMVGAAITVRETWAAGSEVAHDGRAGEMVPVMRGLLIAGPIVAFLWILFAQADPHMDAWGTAIVRAIQNLSFVPRVVFGAGIFVLVFGAYAYVRKEHTPFPTVPTVPAITTFALAATERVIVLAAVAALLALFLMLQVPYLFGNPAGAAGSGVTYAEWAHRGFGELTLASTIITSLIVLLDAHAQRGTERAEGMIRTLALVLVGLTFLVVLSAFRRITLYEAAYGYTTQRLWAQAFMAGIGIALALLALEVRAGLDARRLARHVGLAAAATLAVLVFWNTDAFIVRRNVEHFGGTPKLDIPYLATRLSENAIPALVSARLDLPDNQQKQFDRCLAWSRDERRTLRAGSWYEANVRRLAAVRVGSTLSALSVATSGECWNRSDTTGMTGSAPR